VEPDLLLARPLGIQQSDVTAALFDIICLNYVKYYIEKNPKYDKFKLMTLNIETWLVRNIQYILIHFIRDTFYKRRRRK